MAFRSLSLMSVCMLTFMTFCQSPPREGVKEIAAGAAHTCALLTSGAVVCWGDRPLRTGDELMTHSSELTGIGKMPSGVMAISAGRFHSCALTNAGSVSCWNVRSLCSDAYNQENHVAAIRGTEPALIAGFDERVVALASSGDGTCALTSAGSVQCFDYLEFNLRRFPETVSSLLDEGCIVYIGRESDLLYGPVPAFVEGLDSATARIAMGNWHVCALMTSGTPACWGSNRFGQLGDNTIISRFTPGDVSGLSGGVTSLALGYAHTCALSMDGTVTCWGRNEYGQVGDGTRVNRLEPTKVKGLDRPVRMVVAGMDHTCALGVAGEVWCWGANYASQLGDGTDEDRIEPVLVKGLNSSVQAVAAGDHHTCALIANDEVMCWGKNTRGQLGDGSRDYRAAPTRVIELTGYKTRER